MTQELRKPESNITSLELREGLSPPRRRLLLIEDDAGIRSMLSAFLTSMQCGCVTTSRRDALAFLRRKVFDAVLIDFGAASAAARQFLPKMRRLRPDLMGKTLVITRTIADARATKVLDSYALPHVAENRLIQELWSNLQPLFASSASPHTDFARDERSFLVFDSFSKQSPRRLSGGGTTARHLVYTGDGLFVDLLIGPLPRARRVKVIGRIVANPPGKFALAARPVVLVGRSGSLSHATTNHRGEFHLESSPVDNLTVRIQIGNNSWIATPLHSMDWIREAASSPRV